MLNFIGIGAQKSGTTWLYSSLIKHPQITFPGGKEIHFWDKNYNIGIDWYKQLFNDNTFISGDITPAYGILPINKIKEINSYFPHIRIIYIIRNPIERAWSHAKMVLNRQGLILEQTPDQLFIEHFKSASSLSRGDYELCIRQWSSVFSKDKLLIIKFDDIKKEPDVVLNRCLKHIGLSYYYNKSDILDLSKPVFKGYELKPNRSLSDILFDIYINKIESLELFLGEDLSNWKSNN